MDDDATQPATQQVLDPRRLGRNNSGLTAADVADVLCILHPASPAAFRIVASTAELTPQHVLQIGTIETFDDGATLAELEEQDTFVIGSDATNTGQDLALRFSSRTVQPVLGFCFGRNPRTCDIVLDADSLKRVSNLHFRIFVNGSGVLMLQDMSTNGTLVDETHLKGKTSRTPATRMLNAGSIIQIPSIRPDELVKFIVRIPSRTGYYNQYSRKMQDYMNRVAEAERQQTNHAHTQLAQAPNYPVRAPMIAPIKPFGMNWDGGEEYNVVGLLGKGAFATVYRLATKLDGNYYAAKELEKKRFIKNGRLDQRLDNEMRIMKSIRHDNIVQYINYQDHADHLYIIMEYVPGGDLQDYLAANDVLTEQEGKLMSRQVLNALHYLHGKRITHRDIKPDNILIASSDPFVVKLSDFGLSKVVNTNETFLKTFCGTLLYCAPEVFPHYEEHVTQQGVKRRRSGNAQAKFHSYSQSVDIWSYAAVLWLSLCKKPPFEGVVDNTGRGMFNKIMETRLDVTHLMAHGVPDDAIKLMCRMLNTDPSKRPTEVECLQSSWLFDGRKLPLPSDAAHGLGAIVEEEEGAPSVEGQAKAFSQLSVNELPTTAGAASQMPHLEEEEEEEEVQFDSGDFDFLDPQKSKRVKVDKLVPRHHIRDQAAIPSSSSEHSFPSDNEEDSGIPIPGRQQLRQPRLFGEIGNSALQSSRVLDAHTHAALAFSSNAFAQDDMNEDSMAIDASGVSYQGRQTSDLYRSDASFMNHSSIMGAESGLRGMNMMELPSPEPDTSGDGSDLHSNEPQTPKTPDVFSEPSHNTKSPPSQAQRPSQDGTPTQKKLFDQQTAPLEATMRLHQNFNNKSNIPNPSTTPAMIASGVLTSAPSLGKLTSTADSAFTTAIVLPLNNRISHWGRDPGCTFVYPDKLDTRISKRAFCIFFHAYGIEKEEREGREWTQMPDVRTFISTVSRNGIWVNGVPLAEKDKAGNRLCGTLYSGDVITVWKKGEEAMSFVCDFYVGQAEARRPEDLPFRTEPAIEPGSSQDRSGA